MPINYEVIRDVLIAEGFPEANILLCDSKYSLPDEKYISNLGNRFGDFLFAAGLNYASERFDCDKFSLGSKFLTELDQAASSNKSGLAFGFCSITTYSTDEWCHSVCFAVIEQPDGKMIVKFYEPQPINNVCLTEIPRNTIGALLWCYM
jgi:hypothetical protein